MEVPILFLWAWGFSDLYSPIQGSLGGLGGGGVLVAGRGGVLWSV